MSDDLSRVTKKSGKSKRKRPNDAKASVGPPGSQSVGQDNQSVPPIESKSDHTSRSQDHASEAVAMQGPIEIPTLTVRASDVLLGRGRIHRKHPGNTRLQVIVDIHRDQYKMAKSRDEKTELTKSIVRIIKGCGTNPGRFLKFDEVANGWLEVDDESARQKVAHALRDNPVKPPGEPSRSSTETRSTEGVVLPDPSVAASDGLNTDDEAMLLRLYPDSTKSSPDSDEKKPPARKRKPDAPS